MPTRLKPPRSEWGRFPDVVLHANESLVKTHASYHQAKVGDADAAFELVAAAISEDAVLAISKFKRSATPTLVSVHAFERDGINAIPEVLAREIGRRLNWPVDSDIVQVNVVGHTGANGFKRIANQAAFDGNVTKGADYVLVDDFIGQGGTLANLKGFIEAAGGRAIGATALTGKPYSAIIAPTSEQLDRLRSKHGQNLENWWSDRFGHTFDCLTQSEARYLERTETADAIASKVVASEQA